MTSTSPLVLVWGDDDDPPVARVTAELERRRCATVGLTSELTDVRYDVTISPSPTGTIEVGGTEVPVEAISGVYFRPGTPPTERVATASALSALISCLHVPVVNRPMAGRSNWSKPYQLHLLAVAGFNVPDTIVTTSPDAALRFSERHDRIIYKSTSGIRSIVAALDPTDRDRIELVRNGPVQFQQWIPGHDVRVHVVDERWFATAIVSEALDYRYPRIESEVGLAASEIPDALGAALVEFTRARGLHAAGVDLRRTPDSDWYALEVNPSPGFSYYEDATGQPIASAIADVLTDAVHRPHREPVERPTA